MKHYTVEKKESGERLDKYLLARLDGFSRGKVKGLIDAGRVKVNGKRVVIAKWEMIEGDDVEVRLEGWEQRSQEKHGEEKKKVRPAGEKAGPREKRPFIKIVYEDRDILVVEKPAGEVIQPGERHRGERSFVDHLRSYLRTRHRGRGAFVKPVHRLDKDTSGLMVFAKSKQGEGLVQQFKRHNVERSYLAVVEGAVRKESGEIRLPIEKGNFGYGKKASVRREGQGSRALTHFLVKERYPHASLLRLDLKTGRTHQARVHMAAINHPIVGDRIYGRPGGQKFSRQALHSHFLSFKHPTTGKRMRFKSELPEDMKGLVDELRGR